ncbi:protein SAWADEE HOMEODOMAIN HOMOLOG 1-like isoform X4 [Carica papaya]|uniref:protein SAWADEE HOMEODOMAIN HOMOLOG 1-like isoform X4 n=1 Tax=Carica papaya TaxID=3649 RepID=UPI000B8CC999|nr:protein SAWADEE HOMEODOMAIN HOMOLOG 1-like isoform X4 [Carica papaya]
MDGIDSLDSLPEFTLAEILEMESMFKEIAEESLNREVCQGLATSFNCSPNRIGKSAILWQQVHAWFMDKYKSKTAMTPMPMKMRFESIDFSCENTAGDISQTSRKPRGSPSTILWIP